MTNTNKLSLEEFLNQVTKNSQQVEFEQVMQVISDNYTYQPCAFVNGDINNESGTNEGSCKIFSFAQLNNLNIEQTLACFGRYYRDDVQKHPDGNDHGNIRNFIKTGWQGIEFNGLALKLR